jgi:hypothetical protein
VLHYRRHFRTPFSFVDLTHEKPGTGTVKPWEAEMYRSRCGEVRGLKPFFLVPVVLLSLIGTVFAPPVVNCQTMVFTVTPTAIQFPSTQAFSRYMFPTRVQMTLTNLPISDGHLSVSVPAGFKAFYDVNGQYAWTDMNFGRYDSNSTSTFTAAFYVQYSPTDSVGSSGTITNTISITLRNPPYTNTVLANTVTLTSTPSTLLKINVFPYSYNWTTSSSFIAQPDGRTYVGGDGYWRSCKGQYSAVWWVDKTNGYVKTNSLNTNDTLFTIVDATGFALSGGETFSFGAWKAAYGTNTGTMTIVAGSTVQTLQVSAMQETSQPYSIAIPSELSNTIFPIFIIVNSPKIVYVDNPQIDNGALPIQLGWFRAASIARDAVELKWETLSETNNYGFLVQRYVASVWQDISPLIPGHGTTIAKHTYAYTDQVFSEGNIFPIPNVKYRLCQIDLDGTKSLSAEVSLTMSDVSPDVPYAFELKQNYPNPFNPSTVIDFSLAKSGYTTLKVYDILGREIVTLIDGNLEAGAHGITWDANTATTGTYFAQLSSGNSSKILRMQLVE